MSLKFCGFFQVFKFGSDYRFGLPILNFLTGRLGGPEIDDQLEAGRLLDRQISRFCAAEQLDELPAPQDGSLL
jgi:hypothetical protein